MHASHLTSGPQVCPRAGPPVCSQARCTHSCMRARRLSSQACSRKHRITKTLKLHSLRFSASETDVGQADWPPRESLTLSKHVWSLYSSEASNLHADVCLAMSALMTGIYVSKKFSRPPPLQAIAGQLVQRRLVEHCTSATSGNLFPLGNVRHKKLIRAVTRLRLHLLCTRRYGTSRIKGVRRLIQHERAPLDARLSCIHNTRRTFLCPNIQKCVFVACLT